LNKLALFGFRFDIIKSLIEFTDKTGLDASQKHIMQLSNMGVNFVELASSVVDVHICC